VTDCAKNNDTLLIMTLSIARAQALDVKKHTLLAFYSWKDKKDYTLLPLSLAHKYQTRV
jgi:hypothetical protein